MKLPPKEKFEDLRQKYNLALILLHGSQVTGLTHPESDIDIAVLRSDPDKNLDILGLTADLISVFGNDTVDVSDLTAANPLLLYTATQKSLLLAGEKMDYDRLCLKAFNRYNDYRPYFEIEKNLIKERAADYVTS